VSLDAALTDLLPSLVLGASTALKIVRALVMVLFVLSSVLLIAVVLLQEGKGGGIAGAFGGAAAETFGVKAGSVNRFTSILATVFVGLALLVGESAVKFAAPPAPTAPFVPPAGGGAPPGGAPPAAPAPGTPEPPMGEAPPVPPAAPPAMEEPPMGETPPPPMDGAPPPESPPQTPPMDSETPK
jgi:preprotein translocase subunit SecG